MFMNIPGTTKVQVKSSSSAFSFNLLDSPGNAICGAKEVKTFMSSVNTKTNA